MNDRDYSALPGIRRSDLAYMAKTPLHFKWHMEHPEDPTPAMAFGSAAHAFILENDKFSEEYAFTPDIDRRTKEGKEIYRNFMEANGDKTLLPWDTQDVLIEMSQALHANEAIRKILTTPHRTEVPFYWQDGKTGEICKVKADIITEIDSYPYVIDYKTTASCDEREFYRSCRKFGYDLQAGMYLEGINLCTVSDHKFAFIAQEKVAPYACRLCICDEGFVEQGIKKFHQLLDAYHICRVNDIWEGYPEMTIYGEMYD